MLTSHVSPHLDAQTNYTSVDSPNIRNTLSESGEGDMQKDLTSKVSIASYFDIRQGIGKRRVRLCQ